MQRMNFILPKAIGKTTPIADPQKGTYSELLDTALATPASVPGLKQNVPNGEDLIRVVPETDFNEPLNGFTFLTMPEPKQIPEQMRIDFDAPLSTLELLKNRRLGIPSKPKIAPFIPPNTIPPVDPVIPPEPQILENLPGQGFLDFYDDSDPQMRIFPAFENYPQLTQNVPIETASALKQLFEQLKMNFQ